MSYHIELTEEALFDLKDSYSWYEEQKENLGESFLEGIEQRLKNIESNPYLYPLKGKYREAIVQKFPFVIVFEI